ncbi:MAG TPA: hypothetical protein VF541_03020 [Longimicrobium sp.]
MRKLKLDLDNLSVESFSAEPHERPSVGTVRGNEVTPACGDSDVYSCNNGTCFLSCDTVCGSYYCTPSSDNQSQVYIDGGCV